MGRSRVFTSVVGTALLVLAGCSDDPVVVEATTHNNGVCIPTPQIDHTEIPDDSIILFHMKDGKTWRNTLTFACPGLKLEEGFAYVVDAPEICSGEQTIRVLRSGIFCELGQFTPVTPLSKTPN